MCSPTLALGAFGAVASIYQANVQAANLRRQADAADRNAAFSDWQALDAEERGAEREAAHREKVARLAGEQGVAMGASGFSVYSESFIDVKKDTAYYAELDAQNIRDNAAREAFGYDVQADNFRAEASSLRTSAKNAKTSGYIGAFTSVLGGAYAGGHLDGVFGSSTKVSQIAPNYSFAYTKR